MEKTISIILPNYNGRTLLLENIPSLIKSLKYSECKYEIIVVDDCSTDDSVEVLKSAFPEVIIIKNKTNKGFSATCNNGILAAKNRLLCIVNTDVTFDINYFRNAISYFDNSNLFALKGNIVNYNVNFENVVNIEKVSLLYFKRGFLKFNQKIEYIPNSFTGKTGGQFVLLGCCFLCDRNKMITLGGFNEIFSPYYWEDADLAIRSLKKGYELKYEPSCIVYHKTSSTISSYVTNNKRRLVSIRNKFLFSWYHLDGFKQWSIHIAHVVFSLLTRWIILDWKYYLAFVNGFIRFNKES